MQREEIQKCITELNDALKARQESISLFKGRLMNQITSVKEMIAKVLDKDISLAEKKNIVLGARYYNHFHSSILMAIGMTISILVEALLPSGTAGTAGKPLPKNEKRMKEWLRNNLNTLARLLGRLGMKVAEALPGIIGVIVSWSLNRAKEVVGCVLEIYGRWS